MTTIKISQLPDATLPLTGAEVVPLDQNGITKKTTASAFGSNNVVSAQSFGAVGDGGALTTIYQKRASAWVGIV